VPQPIGPDAWLGVHLGLRAFAPSSKSVKLPPESATVIVRYSAG
jgi:hypothetical protein